MRNGFRHMDTLHDIFGNHPICIAQQRLRRQEILDSFRAWVKEDQFIEWHFSLYRFALIRPLKYYDSKTVDTALTFFEQYPKETLDAIIEQYGSLTHSILSMIRGGSSWGKENQLTFGEPPDLLDFEKIWHPEYQRYSEHVFNHLIRVPLAVLGKIKGKDYQSLFLSNQVDIIRNNNLELLTKGFNRVVRNAISHGSTTFEILGIKYSDRNLVQFLTVSEFSRLFDELVDTCHSMFVGILLFLCKQHTELENIGLEKIPLGIRFLIIDSLSSHSGFSILSMIESWTIENQRQLNIACKINTLSRRMHIFESLNVARNSMRYGGKYYNRLAITIDCSKKIPVTLFLNADRLRQALVENESIGSSLPGIIETGLLWFDSSGLFRRIYIWKNLISMGWQKFKHEHVEERRKRGLNVVSSKYFIRHIENKSNKNVRRIEGHIILKERGVIEADSINAIVKHAVKTLKKYRVKLIGLGKESLIKRRPAYIWIRLYANDKRIRTLMMDGWHEKNLILQAEWFSIWMQTGPIVIKKPQSVIGRIRVEYNPILLENN